MQRYREGTPITKQAKGNNTQTGLTRAEQFQHILATNTLDEVSLGQYCREHGLYSHQLTEWKEQLMKPQDNKTQIFSEMKALMKALKEENQQLQQEARWKDKALAEASALLIMKKKADLIWGVSEED